mmetsp:Transcript_6789/g.11707  ORF Transcript_6789/g.11707 Transcript_6789/m.11707 type:complete len:116 (-) Transcript_6789:452-799(-)|eukprot:CAMPEP_0198211678 /NCGR_PEP_ID=MMETSP1445-20131203/25102_1 /TAXON_ID=36898 /ORGANISM="Pyramimonas sp., Strain CCMP2087" /LENGTH=115 /DNA_ID=CAMNT_0043885997 /DNA_START=97 /DNA_END=444 /DNA_ORIENTATION=+
MSEGTPTEGLGTRALAARALGGGGGGKYGAVNPKKKLIHKDVKYFDSADWALQKEGATPKDAQSPVSTEDDAPLQPKLQPTNHNPECRRTPRSSTLSIHKCACDMDATTEQTEGN